MRPIVLWRNADLEAIPEKNAAEAHLPLIESRLEVQRGDLVIARYSCWPFYTELEKDINRLGAQLINSYKEHQYVADVAWWATDLGNLTPQTWTRLSDIPDDGPFVLKGKTYSKKFNWDSMMFAASKQDAISVYCRLQDDELIGRDDIYIRRFVPLKRLTTGPHGLPISEEYRFFVACGQILCGGFYWSSYSYEFPNMSADVVPRDFLNEAISRIGRKIPFFAMDVARTESGDWMVVELNDGQMSGLSENPASALYKGLSEQLASPELQHSWFNRGA